MLPSAQSPLPASRGEGQGEGQFPSPLRHSLALKLFSVVFLVLLLNLGLLGYVNVRLHRQHLEDARLSAAERMSDVVRRSTSYYMLRNDREALRHIVETIGKEPGFTRLRIINHEGRVGFSTRTREIGTRVHVPGSIVPIQQSRIFSSGEHRSLGISTPILNSPSCSNGACHAHPGSQEILGTLDLNLSLQEADADVRKASLQFVTYSALAILLTLATIGLLVWYFVHEPVRVLRDGTVNLGRGDLGVQIPVRSSDELGQLASSFNEMSRQLRDAREEANRFSQQQLIHAEKLTSLGKLAAVVAHEINNPLSGILTYAKLLRKWIERGDELEGHKTDMRDSLQLIENESRRCGEIVRNLLTFAREQPLNISNFDLNAVVRQTLKLVEHKLDLGAITTHLELSADLPQIRGDAGQVEQLLLALIMNAIEAMPHDGNLHVVTSAKDPATVVIRIADNGIGIPPDLLPRLFEPFMTTKEEGGVGLGLAISRSIVERHGGTIGVQSEVGRGTTFTITFPTGGLACTTKDASSSWTTSQAFAIP